MMPDLKYLSRVLYILISCFFKQIVDIFFNNVYYQESYKLIIEYSVVPVAEWLDGSFESQSKL
jgi:thiamine transporter ThiT